MRHRNVDQLLARAVFACAIACAFLGAGCETGGDRDAGPRGDAEAGDCVNGQMYCGPMETVQVCQSNMRRDVSMCPTGTLCAEGLGCVACRPGNYECRGQELWVCNSEGNDFTLSMSCTADEVCNAVGPLGMCRNACAEAVAERSNLGCEYWAVDLDNESTSIGMGIDPYSAQFAIAIANPSDVTASVRVFVNDAALGAAPVERQLMQVPVPPQTTIEIPLDQREVDGPPGEMVRDNRGSYLSPNAYRIESNYPVVAYEFNPIVQNYSNDASLLLPTSGLDLEYRVLGYPTSKPVDPFGSFDGVPDHSYVTIVGTEANTTVRVTPTHAIVGDNYGLGVGPAMAGETLTFTINRYDVLNLETDGAPGDLTGTVVQSSAPVAVFSGGEAAIAPVGNDAPPPPGGIPESRCCTEHLEEQVFPTTSWGRDFVMTHSPRRGASWVEPDIYRIMADRAAVTVTTNLAGADASFTIQPGEWREFYAQESFILRASGPVSIEQILVSQGWVDDWVAGNGGDPSMIFFPPYEQYRDHYTFLTPSTFSADYVVISMPVSTQVLLDGGDIMSDEFMMLCTYETAGDLEGITYQAVTCPVEAGSHTIEADMPVGITVYGYYSVGSYGYVGGSNLERINPLI
ncbi:MAG: IgGFc-binding protein [Sandaracinaceae bacterium]